MAIVLTVMTWNVENLFRPGGEFGPDTPAAYEAKIRALAATIIATDPHLVGLQEIGDPAALADLVAVLPGDWHTVTSSRFDARHPIRVAVISRLPLEVVADVATTCWAAACVAYARAVERRAFCGLLGHVHRRAQQPACNGT